MTDIIHCNVYYLFMIVQFSNISNFSQHLKVKFETLLLMEQALYLIYATFWTSVHSGNYTTEEHNKVQCICHGALLEVKCICICGAGFFYMTVMLSLQYSVVISSLRYNVYTVVYVLVLVTKMSLDRQVLSEFLW